MTKNITLNYDAFSEGQVASKIWLCEELERIMHDHHGRAMLKPQSIFILGGWYGVLAFLLLSRKNIPIDKIRSIDIDPATVEIADRINNTWLINRWQFKALHGDANDVEFEDADIVINTSTEHFEVNDWFDTIEEGTLVCLQGNNMNHDDHVSEFTSMDDFKKKYPLSRILFEGTKEFKYPEWGFTRYMLIGQR
jgi:hypothetical protein